MPQVDPSRAPLGLSCAQVLARDATSPGRGPLARISATLIRPEAFPPVSPHPFPLTSPPPAVPAVSANGASSTPAKQLGADAVDLPGHAADALNGQQALHLGRLAFAPGTEVRRFVAIPEGATWGELVLKAGDHDTPRCVHSLLQPCHHSGCLRH